MKFTATDYARRCNALMHAYELAFIGKELDYEHQCMAEDMFYAIMEQMEILKAELEKEPEDSE
ncbi:MAG: hypothetical protein LUE27_10985 [Clostridia bacterium]|nr:hypothetical protein [Clostridia bacterium]